MRFIAKYGIGLYLLISLLFKISFIIPPSLVEVLYQILMGLGIVLFFGYYKLLFKPENKKAFAIFYFIVFLNLLYLIVFTYNTESVLYIAAKFSTANLIALGLISNYKFYREIFIKYFTYFIVFLLLVGYFFSGITSAEAGVQRLSLGFNPNDIGLFGGLGVLSIMFFNNKWYSNKKDILLLIFCFLFTLFSGSKAALLNVMVGIVFLYGFKPKLFLSAILFFIIVAVIPKFGYVTGIDRFDSKNTFSSRDQSTEAGLLTFKDAIMEGHGLDKYGWTNPMYWDNPRTALGPHSTYLAVGIMYGALFGSIFIFIILSILIKAIKLNFKHSDVFARFCSLLIVLSIVNGFFETLIVGVNEFITVIFWFAVGVVLYYKLNYKVC